MTQNPTCVKIMRSIFMNKKTISFHIYQANRLEQLAENQCVAGIIGLQTTELRFERQLRVANARSRYSNRTVTLLEHSATFITYSITELYYIAGYSVQNSATNS